MSEEKEEMLFEIVPRSEQIIQEPDPCKKIEQFARICYRTEDKIKEGSSENLLKHCISNDHGSVLEHFYVSMYFPSEGNFKSFFGYEHMTPSHIWQNCNSDAKQKFIREHWDRYIKINTSIPDGQNLVWRCSTGNLRVWRDMIGAGLEASLKQDIYPAVVLHIAMLKEMNRIAPIFFEDIVNWFNSIISVALAPGKSLERLLEDLDRRDWTLENIPESKIGIGIQAAEAIGYAASFIAVTDRAVTHQLVRHRINCSYSQESQRYCDYQRKGIGVCVPVLDPWDHKGKKPSKYVDMIDSSIGFALKAGTEVHTKWAQAMQYVARAYNALRDLGLPAESARGVLPNDSSTMIGVTMTFTALEHWFNKRLDWHAQYGIRSMAARVLQMLIESEHPVLVNIHPRVITKWCKWLILQHNGDIQFWENTIVKQEERARLIREENELRMKRERELVAREEAIAKTEQLKKETRGVGDPPIPATDVPANEVASPAEK